MSDSKEKTKEILKRVEDTLRSAEIGLDMLKSGNPKFVSPGLRNVVVFGRSVTNVLQTLRRTEKEYDEWYSKYREEMKKDPLMKYFYDLRSEILKEGKLPTSTSAYIKFFSPDYLSLFPKPPNAKSFFIGDRFGGSGWEVELPDGTVEKYYIQLPTNLVDVTLHFEKSPNTHLGKNIENEPIDVLANLYVKYLRNMVLDAKKRFTN